MHLVDLFSALWELYDIIHSFAYADVHVRHLGSIRISTTIQENPSEIVNHQFIQSNSKGLFIVFENNPVERTGVSIHF